MGTVGPEGTDLTRPTGYLEDQRAERQIRAGAHLRSSGDYINGVVMAVGEINGAVAIDHWTSGDRSIMDQIRGWLTYQLNPDWIASL